MLPFNEAILSTFENAIGESTKGQKEIFFYPLKTHKQARAFAKAIQRNGLPIEELCKELNETVDNFKLWKFKKGAPLVGVCLMDKVNSYIGTVFLCTNDKYCKSIQFEEPIKLKEVNEMQNFDEKCKRNVNHIVSESKFDVAEIKIEVSAKHFHNNKVPPPSKPFVELISDKNSKESERFIDKSCDLNLVSPLKSLMCNSDANQLSFIDDVALQNVEFTKKQATKNNSRIQALIDKFNRLSRKSTNGEFEKRDLHISKERSFPFEKKSVHFANKLSMHHFNPFKGENFTSLDSNNDGLKSTYNQAKDNKNKKIFVSSGQDDMPRKHVERASSNCDTKGTLPHLRPQLRTSTFSVNKETTSRRIYPERSEKVKTSFECLDATNSTTSGDKPLFKVFNHFIPGRINNNYYKIGQKELKDSTNLQIKSNVGLKFGINVASIISKFNKLQ